MWSRDPHDDQKEKMDKARGQVHTEAVDNITNNKPEVETDGEPSAQPRAFKNGGQGLQKHPKM
jgi:hypothetical protein